MSWHHFLCTWRLAGDCTDTILVLLENEARIDVGDFNNDSALHLAASMAPVEAVKLLLRAGAPVNARNSSGDTPLHKAAGRGDATILKVLLENGGNPLATNSTGKTPRQLLTSDNANGWEQLVAAEADLRDTLSSASFTLPEGWVVEDVVQSYLNYEDRDDLL